MSHEKDCGCFTCLEKETPSTEAPVTGERREVESGRPMSDREMLLLLYGAIKAVKYFPTSLIQTVEEHLFEPAGGQTAQARETK